MKPVTKIILFFFLVSLGIMAVDQSLSALRKTCYCSNETEAQGECTFICMDYNETECLYTIPYLMGCDGEDCDTLWRFECEPTDPNSIGACGYIWTTWHNCPECDIIN
jgi:hypothetical protein